MLGLLPDALCLPVGELLDTLLRLVGEALDEAGRHVHDAIPLTSHNKYRKRPWKRVATVAPRTINPPISPNGPCPRLRPAPSVQRFASDHARTSTRSEPRRLWPRRQVG